MSETMLATVIEARREARLADLRWRWDAGREVTKVHDRLWAEGVRRGPHGQGTGAAMSATEALGVDKSSVSQFQKFSKRVPWELVEDALDRYNWGWREWRVLIYAPDDVKLAYQAAPKHCSAKRLEDWCRLQIRLAKRGVPPPLRLKGRNG